MDVDSISDNLNFYELSKTIALFEFMIYSFFRFVNHYYCYKKIIWIFYYFGILLNLVVEKIGHENCTR